MRRTITTLMFLAAGGFAMIASAADHSRGTSNWQYYAAGENGYRISDDEEDEEVAPAAAQSPVKQAATTAPAASTPAARPEKNALYVPELSGTVGTGIAPTNYLANGGGSCGCAPACGCGQNPCGCGGNSCLSDCYCDCSTNWFRFEYLMWFSRGRNTPPLVTTSDPGTARADAGVLGLGTTTVLYGDEPIGTDIRSGGRLTFSHLFADGITYADVRFWGVEDSSETFTAAGTPIIARPFFNVGLGQQDAFLVAFPGVTSPGSIRVLSKNDLIGGDAYVRRNLWDDGYGSLDVLGGYQFSRLDDSIAIGNTSTSIDPGAALPVGSQISIFDSFRTQNEFHGASAGIMARSYRGAVTIEALAKIAIGNMRQQVTIDGNTTVTTPGGAPSTSTGGLLALPTNIGSEERNRFAFVPEINVNLLYDVSDNWRLIGGYSFIYWNNVVLAGNQIDPALNLTQLPGPIAGPALPAARFNRTDFWVQGMNFGAEYRW
jgi:hypothetical protein